MAKEEHKLPCGKPLEFFIPATYSRRNVAQPSLVNAINNKKPVVSQAKPTGPAGAGSSPNPGRHSDRFAVMPPALNTAVSTAESAGASSSGMRTSVDGHIAGRPLSEAHKLLVSAPGGALDLSQYDYKPQIAPPTITSTQTGSADMATTGLMASEAAAGLRSPTQSRGLAEDTNTDEECERKRLRRFMRPRRNSKLDRVIAFLEDKRVKDDADIHRLDDLQMPRLRRILNIIFVTLGVCFLLAVVIVIIYTTLTK